MATKRANAPPAPEATAPPEFDMSDPSSSSYGEGARFLRDMLDPAARITDAGASVLHWARRLAKAGLTRPARLELARSRKLFGRASRTLNNYDLPAEVSQAIGGMVREAFHVGVIRGQHWQVLRGREGMPKARIEPAQKGKVSKKETRLKLEREIIKSLPRPLDGDKAKLVRWLGVKLKEHTGIATPPSTIRRDIKTIKRASTP
jgi:hypothetical protein